MDPLSQLKDIHLPEQINNYPLAYGWWMLALVIVVISILLVRLWLIKRKLNKAKKQALAYLASEQLQPQQIIAILKWACLQYFPRQQVAALHSDKLITFFIQQLPEKSQQATFTQVLRQAILHQYQAPSPEDTCDVEKLKNAARQWLTLALAPNKKQRSVINDNYHQQEVKQ
ncbi:membrane protein [Thalassotalea insulae]|uniref:Membrane protein n=1 Tax=Thalassotalea insulae TaxID=2056778 RepID=A0ABQ6GSW8_9GAMM|nr:DUF4381 domain-containing protein [Thalassotalea insulae]GLX77545.1 membrane protein [Thalassotalea insulae]